MSTVLIDLCSPDLSEQRVWAVQVQDSHGFLRDARVGLTELEAHEVSQTYRNRGVPAQVWGRVTLNTQPRVRARTRFERVG